MLPKSTQAEVRRAVARAEKLLPGRPLDDPKAADPRWQAIIKVGYFIEQHPEPIWDFALKWAKHAQEDLRTAIATVLLEHLLADHFDLLFPRVHQAACKSRRFADTLRRCYWMGQAERPGNAAALDRLVRKTSQGPRDEWKNVRTSPAQPTSEKNEKP